jgi:hypothetical protein
MTKNNCAACDAGLEKKYLFSFKDEDGKLHEIIISAKSELFQKLMELNPDAEFRIIE